MIRIIFQRKKVLLEPMQYILLLCIYLCIYLFNYLYNEDRKVTLRNGFFKIKFVIRKKLLVLGFILSQFKSVCLRESTINIILCRVVVRFFVYLASLPGEKIWGTFKGMKSIELCFTYFFPLKVSF